MQFSVELCLEETFPLGRFNAELCLDGTFEFGNLYVCFDQMKQRERSDISEREDSKVQKKQK